MDKRFFEIDESMMKVVFVCVRRWFCLPAPMLNRVVDVELLDSKTFMDHRINCVRFANRKGMLHTAAVKDG